MPSKSEKQRRFMEMACKDAKFAKKHNIDQKVACEFVEADRKLKKDQKATESIQDLHIYARW